MANILYENGLEKPGIRLNADREKDLDDVRTLLLVLRQAFAENNARQGKDAIEALRRKLPSVYDLLTGEKNRLNAQAFDDVLDEAEEYFRLISLEVKTSLYSADRFLDEFGNLIVGGIDAFDLDYDPGLIIIQMSSYYKTPVVGGDISKVDHGASYHNVFRRVLDSRYGDDDKPTNASISEPENDKDREEKAHPTEDKTSKTVNVPLSTTIAIGRFSQDLTAIKQSRDVLNDYEDKIITTGLTASVRYGQKKDIEQAIHDALRAVNDLVDIVGKGKIDHLLSDNGRYLRDILNDFLNDYCDSRAKRDDYGLLAWHLINDLYDSVDCEINMDLWIDGDGTVEIVLQDEA